MVKRVISVLLAAALLVGVLAPVAHAQVSFLFGLAAGALLFGDKGNDIHEVGPNTVYLLPRASERVKSPLKIKFARYDLWSTHTQEDHAQSLSSMFAQKVPFADRFVILEIVRIFKPTAPIQAVFWFAYIEKEEVLSLKDLKFRETYGEK